MDKIRIQIKYDIAKDAFEVETNANKEGVIECVEMFLTHQIGAGADDSKPNQHDVYIINITVDLSFDQFEVSSNTGNKGLRDGILIKFLSEEQLT